MIGLIGAEVLKLRKRWATYIIPMVGIVLMGLVFLLLAISVPRPGDSEGSSLVAQIRFPSIFAVIDGFVFVLGSILAVAYAGGVAGADWSWGIVRIVIARGEGRVRYVLAKAAGFAIVLVVGVLVAYAMGILFAFAFGGISGYQVGNPFGDESRGPLLQSLWRGTFVLMERCAIGFALAMLVRSQLAGAIAGIVLAVGEPIVTTLLQVFTFARQFGNQFGEPIGNQWFQYLPFNIGNSLLQTAGTAADPGSALLPPVPFEQAVITVFLYTVLALAIACIRTIRSQVAV